MPILLFRFDLVKSSLRRQECSGCITDVFGRQGSLSAEERVSKVPWVVAAAERVETSSAHSLAMGRARAADTQKQAKHAQSPGDAPSQAVAESRDAARGETVFPHFAKLRNSDS